MKPLLNGAVLFDENDEMKPKFVKNVFLNARSLYSSSFKLYNMLQNEQIKNDYFIARISDILVDNDFEEFVTFGAGQPYSQYLLDNEIKSNEQLREFIDVISFICNL